jgi:hypothetical protein
MLTVFAGDEMNRFLNENSKLLFTELKPVIEETFENVLLQVANSVLLKVPYKTIFLGN